MKKKRMLQKTLRQTLSWLLLFALLAPNMTPIASEAAAYLANRPRYVDFSRPSALTLRELGLATGSDAIGNGEQPSGNGEQPSGSGEQPSGSGEQPSGNSETPSGSHGSDLSGIEPHKEGALSEAGYADPSEDPTLGAGEEKEPELPVTDESLRQPEDFYGEPEPEEEGTLVQFSDGCRTYETGEGQYVTVIGGYSGRYRGEDGRVHEVDNTLVLGAPDSLPASSSSAFFRSRRASFVENESNSAKVRIPLQMSASRGVTLETGSGTMELIPTAGRFREPAVAGNAIRFNDVFEHVDVQYTVLGDHLKEDILLLEPGDRYEFSYRLKIPGLLARQSGDTIVIYEEIGDEERPVYFLDAPMMEDDSGEQSTKVKIKLSGKDGSYKVTVKADKKWLSDEDRTYPVRIDPASYVPPDEFIFMPVSSAHPDTHYDWDSAAYVGYSSERGDSRVLVAFNIENDEAIMSILTGATECTQAQFIVTAANEHPDRETVLQLMTPTAIWSSGEVTWNTQPSYDTVGGDNECPAGGAGQPMTFDITELLNLWIGYRKDQLGFLLKAKNDIGKPVENPALRMPAIELYNRGDSERGPKIRVAWNGELPSGDLAARSVNDTTVEVTPAIEETDVKSRNTTGVIAHGLAQAGAEVTYELVEGGEPTNTEGEWSGDKTDADGSLTDPDFGKAGLPDDFSKVKDSNWQTDGYAPTGDLQYDTYYLFQAYATGLPDEALGGDGEDGGDSGDGEDPDVQPVAGKTVYTENFLLYEVKEHDLATRIAKHYGISASQLALDNHLYKNQLTEMGTVLFIRDPKTDEPYTPEPMTLLQNQLLLNLTLGDWVNCVFGLEPINLNTGDFFMTQTDTEIAELDGPFGVTRSYNAMLPDYHDEFGYGWSSPFGEHLTVLGDGTLLYKRADGKGIPFTKDGDVYRAPEGWDLTLEPLDTLELPVATASDAEEKEDSESEENENGENTIAGTGSRANPRVITTAAIEQAAAAKERGVSPVSVYARAGRKKSAAVATSSDAAYDVSRTGAAVSTNGTSTIAEGNSVGTAGAGNSTGTTADGQAASASDAAPRGLSGIPESVTGTASGTGTSQSDSGSAARTARKTDSSIAPPVCAGWRLTEADGTAYVFDSLGFLQYREDLKGRQTIYTYDEDYYLTRVTSPTGKTLAITMDGEARITDIGLPDGATLHYEYDGDGNLISASNPEGDVRRYEYDDLHRMTAWYDGEGHRVVENVYDDENRVTAQTDANGNTSTLSYSDGCTEVTDNNGHTTAYYYDGLYRTTRIEYPDGSTETRSYADGRLASETDAVGATLRYTYDQNGNLLTVKRSDGATAGYTYNGQNLPLTATDFEGNVSHFTYDAKGNLLTATDGGGNTQTYGYDALSRPVLRTDSRGTTVRFTYDGAVLTALTDGEGHTWRYGYDVMNRLTGETNPLGHETSYTYNLNGWKLAETAKDGGTTRYEFSPAGAVLSITDPEGSETTFTYDAMYHLLSGTDALGHTLTYEYDANYNRVKEIDAKGNETEFAYDEKNRLTAATDALGQSRQLTLDGLGNPIRLTDPRGNATLFTYNRALNQVSSSTDPLGNETDYEYNRNGQPTQITYADGSRLRYTYDAAGRAIAVTAKNGLTTQITYDGNGNIVQLSDDEARLYRFTYDRNNRLIKTVDPLGGVTHYEYDAAGNLTNTTDPETHATGYAYDAAGRLEEIRDALNGTVTTSYNLNGQTTKTTDPNGHSTEWLYDAIGEPLAEVNAAGYVTANEYDVLGNVTKVTDALKGETAYEYDPVSQTTRITDALGHVYTYEYDANGNLIKASMPDGDTVTMACDANNRMIESTDEAGVITTYEYDVLGRIIKASDNTGNRMTYEYDIAGSLVKQTDTIGRSAVYEYDKFGRLVRATGTDGATTAYGYDALDRLVKVTQADGTVTAYEYDKAGNLIRTTEPGEAVYTYTYDAINRLTEKVNPLGAATAFVYDPAGNLTEVTDAEGNQNAYTYDVLNRLTALQDGRGGVTSYEYDELSRLLSYTTPEGNKQEYRYDALGNLLKEKDANGYATEYEYDVMGNLITAISPKGAKTGYTYDKHDELTGVTDPEGNVTSYEVDLNRMVTKLTQKNGGQYTYTYDAVHRLTGITTPLGLERSFTYDAADNIVRDSDSLGRTGGYEYDIMHRLTKATNALGGEETYAYDIRGNVNAVTNAMGHTNTYVYDLIDRLQTSVDPEGKATQFTYDQVGNLTTLTKPGERTTAYQYDENYNPVTVTDPKGYVYQRSYDKDDRMIGTVDPLNQTESVTYDPGSRVTTLTDKMGLGRSFTYDPHGNLLSDTATDGLTTHYRYDLLDRLTQVTDPMGNKTTYDYDVMGNVTSVTDALLHVTEYTYDLEGNLTSLTSAMGRKEQYGYDAGGRITGRYTARGEIIRYDYNTLNELVGKTYSDGDGGQTDHPVQMGYNRMGQRISMEDLTGESTYTYDSLGRLKTAMSGSGKTVEYYYDEANNLQEILYPDGYAVVYEYDKNDNLTELTDRDGRETTYAYDPLNRLTGVTRADGSTSTYTYNARDQIVEAENLCSCGFLISNYQYTYNDAGLITRERAKECLFASDKDYGHQGGPKEACAHAECNPWMNQNPQWQTTDRTFTYDNNGELLECRESKGQFDKTTYTYEYDAVGNRTRAKKQRAFTYQRPDLTTYQYNADNQLVSADVCEGNLYEHYTFRYDANGNLTTECVGNQAKVSYQYDTENRLKAVYDRQKLLMAAAYDGDGNRTFQLNYNPEAVCGYGKGWGGDVFMPEHNTDEDGNPTAEGELFSYLCSETGRAYDLTEYVNDTNRRYTQVLTATTVNSGATESYSYVGNQRLSRNNIWSEGRGADYNETSYYLYDGRGSVTANTWQNGMVTSVYQYDPYGQVTLGSTEHTDFYGYNAESYNPNTGLEYLRARYYNAERGRFFQEDTYLGNLREPLTLNRYAYVGNSPVNFIDPTGHFSLADWLTDDGSRGYDYTATPEYWNEEAGKKAKEELPRDLEIAKRILSNTIKKADKLGIYVTEICGDFGKGVEYEKKNIKRVGMYTTLQVTFPDGSSLYGSYTEIGEIEKALDEIEESVNHKAVFEAGKATGAIEVTAEIAAVVVMLKELIGAVIATGGAGGAGGLAAAVSTGSSEIVVTVGNEAVIGAVGGMAITDRLLNGPMQESADEEEANSKLPNQGTVKGDVENAPSVDAGKQGKHVQGHPNYKEGNSTWESGNTGVHDTQEAWLNGQELPDGTKVWDAGKTTGTNGETGVRVHIDGKGNIHGYPVDPGRYLPGQ